jgi:DNA-binding XRE family transcriptional regulator
MLASVSSQHNDKSDILKELPTEALNYELRRRKQQEREIQQRQNEIEGKQLRQIRDMLGLKQGELAKLLRISQVALCLIETGKRPGAVTLMRRVEQLAQWKDRRRNKATPPV